jgi:hypothetical protein
MATVVPSVMEDMLSIKDLAIKIRSKTWVCLDGRWRGALSCIKGKHQEE